MTPISYLQTDARWMTNDYSAPGEKTTIGKAGCGPTCMAMVIASLADVKVTPADTASWSLKHGYKAKNQGTYYSYFEPQGKAYGISVKQIPGGNSYGKSTDADKKALDAVKAGNWVIACMGPGNWTTSGHFILWYGVDSYIALVNDPYSLKTKQTGNTIKLLQSQAKYYWIVDVKGFKKKHEQPEREDDEEMTQEQFDKMFEAAYRKMMDERAAMDPGPWFDSYKKWLEENKIVRGDENGWPHYMSYPTKAEVGAMIRRAFEIGTDDGK